MRKTLFLFLFVWCGAILAQASIYKTPPPNFIGQWQFDSSMTRHTDMQKYDKFFDSCYLIWLSDGFSELGTTSESFTFTIKSDGFFQASGLNSQDPEFNRNFEGIWQGLGDTLELTFTHRDGGRYGTGVSRPQLHFVLFEREGLVGRGDDGFRYVYSKISEQQASKINHIDSSLEHKGLVQDLVQESRKLLQFFSGSQSWAVVIGVGAYPMSPKVGPLTCAPIDAKKVTDFLITDLNYKPANVFTLIDSQATKSKILSAINDSLEKCVGTNDRVTIYFSCHGTTREGFMGVQLGYLMPYDGRVDFPSSLISMSEIEEWSRSLQVKHVLFVLDACFSGLAGSEVKGDNESKELIEKSLRDPSRNILAAGKKDQEAAGGTPWNGMSAFTYYFLNGLQGSADWYQDSVITFPELYSYIHTKMLEDNRLSQEPQWTKLQNSEGQFVFFREGK